jgi:hypothetical protein
MVYQDDYSPDVLLLASFAVAKTRPGGRPVEKPDKDGLMNRRNVNLFHALVLFSSITFMSFIPTKIFAQAIFGSINGTVTDSSGAIVPNATVTVIDTVKGTTQTVKSNESGNYLVEHLIPDTYTIRVQGEGFTAFEIKAFQVSANTSPRVDAQLQVGSMTQTIEVTTETPQLKTDQADVSDTLNEKSLQNLPNLTRNATSFVALAPGTVTSTGGNSPSENPQQSTPIAANGQSPFSAGFILDGADNKDSFIGEVVINPTLDSLSEMEFTTQNYDAQFGAAAAGIVIAQSKSGGNSFHGDAYDYRYTGAQQARNPFTQYPGVHAAQHLPDVPPSLYSLFGGSVSGPIKHNKIFFFGDYQGTRQKTGASLIETVPTALVHSSCGSGTGCDLSEYLQPTNGQNVGQLYDPRSSTATDGSGRTPFNQNLIPVGEVSQQAVSLINLLPLPTSSGITNNFVATGFGIFNANQYDTRVDAQLSQKLHIFGHYAYFGSLISAPGGFGILEGQGFGANNFAGKSTGRDQSISTGADYEISPNLVTDFRFGFLRYRVLEDKYNGSTSPLETSLGIPGLNTGAPGTGGVSGFIIPGISLIGSGASSGAINVNSCDCPLNEQEQEFQGVNNWTKNVGNHSIKFGGELRYLMNLRLPSDQNRAGVLTFAAARTSIGGNGVTVPGGLGLGTFLLGDITTFTRYVSATTTAAERQKRLFSYIEDSWRVTPKLTFNYGVRWEIYFPETVNGKGQGGFFDINTFNIKVAGYGGIPTNFGVQNTYSYFAPRLGLAYSATDKTVIRAGYGRTLDPGFYGDLFTAVVTQELPVLANQTATSPSQYGYVGFNLAQGPPAFVFPTIPANGQIPLPSNISPTTRPNQMRVPTIDTWNLTLQQQMTPTISLQIAFVGNKTTHESVGNYNINAPTLAVPDGNLCAREQYCVKYGDNQAINYFGNAGTSHYNSLQTVLAKKIANGLQFQTSYVWSKAQANGSYGNFLYYNPRIAYGLFSTNRKNNFVLYGNYDLPFGHGKQFASDVPHWVNGVIGGISLNGTYNWGSGLPFSPTYNECSADEDVGICFPSRVSAVRGSVGALNQTSHTRQFLPIVAPISGNGQASGPYERPQKGTIGNLGTNSIYGPAFMMGNMAIRKNFNLPKKIGFEIEAQAQNVFNHANLANPSSACVDCSITSGAGQISNILANTTMRQLEFNGRFTF